MWRRNSISRNVVLLLGVVLACGGEEEIDGFGLKTVHLIVESEDLSILRNGVYAKSPVTARVEIEGLPFFGEISFAGSGSVDSYKKSYNVELTKSYSGRTTYRLSSMPGDPTAMRALLALHVFQLGGVSVPRAEPVALWTNGEYQGLYLLFEKIDVQFFKARGDSVESLYKARRTVAYLDTTTNLAQSFSVKVGSEELFDLKKMVAVLLEVPSDENRRELEIHLNVENILRYMAVVAFIHHTDGVTNNYHLYRTETEPRFSILPCDLDLTFRHTVKKDNGNIFRQSAMMSRFFGDDIPYRVAYDSYLQNLNERANSEHLNNYIDKLHERISEAYKQDLFLSSGNLSLNVHVTVLKQRIAEEEDLLRQ
jgi:spore coat protein CotH